MPLPRQQNLPPIAYPGGSNISPGFFDLPKDGFPDLLKMRLAATAATISGASTGTVISDPISPAGVIDKIVIEANSPGTEGQKVEFSAQSLYLLGFRAFKKAPRIAGLTSSANGATPLELDMALPFSLVRSKFRRLGLYEASKKKTFRIWIYWKKSDAESYAALVRGGDGSIAFTNMRVEMEFTDYITDDTPQPVYHVVWAYHKHDHISTGKNQKTLSVPTGLSLRSIMSITHDSPSSVLTRVDTALILRVTVKVGAVTVKDYAMTELRPKNENDLSLPAALPAGGWFLEFDQENDLSECPVMKETGTDMILILDTGTVAPAQPSYTESYLELIEVTPHGVQVLAELAAKK